MNILSPSLGLISFPTRLFLVAAACCLLVCGPAAGQDAKLQPYRDLASQFEKAIARRDGEQLAALLDLKAMLQSATENVPADERWRQAFIDGTYQRMWQAGFPVQLMNAAENGGAFTFLRIQQVDGEPQLLFRLLPGPSSGVTYHRYRVDAGNDGRLRIVDFTNLLTGMRGTENLRLGYLSFLESNDPTLWTRLKGLEQSYVQLLPKIETISTSLNAGDIDAALAQIDALPDSIRRNKMILEIEMNAARRGRPERMPAIVQAYRAALPGLPAADLQAIDAFTLSKQFDAALAAVDKVEQAVGGDPYLDVLRAGLLLSSNKIDDAKQLAEELIAEHPDWLNPYWSIAEISIREQDYSRTLAILKQIDERFEVTFNDLSRIPAYKQFVRSTEYRDWSDHLERRTLVPEPGAQPSPEECRDWAEQYAQAIAAGDPAAANKLFDWNQMLSRATRTRVASRKFIDNFNNGFLQAIDSSGFCYEIIQSQNSGSSYKLLSVDPQDARGQVLFRLLLPANSRFNYHRFQLRKTAGGVKCTDVGVLFTGELLSQTMRRTFLMAVMQNAGRADVGLNDQENLLLELIPAWQQLQGLAQAGQPREALQHYDRLPARVQKSREMLILRSELAFQVGQAEYAAALNELRGTFPRSASIAMNTLFGYTQLEDYAAALECIELLEQTIGEDAYLDVLRANIHRLGENPRKAREAADRALQREASLPEAAWIRLQLALDEKDYPRTVELLKHLEDDLKVPLGELTALPAFAEFIQTPHYAEWKQSRSKK